MKKFTWSLMVLLGINAVALATEDLKFRADRVYPEGIAYNPATKDFYVSSMRKGTIGRVDARGKYWAFIYDTLLVSSVGIQVDAARNRLLVCVSDPGVAISTAHDTQKKIARLLVFDTKSRKRVAQVELAPLTKKGEHFCNDMTVDGEGNIFVTDSFSPYIYKIDNDYKASVFSTSKLYEGQGFNLNGIVFHQRENAFLVAKYNEGLLYKIDRGSPNMPQLVTIAEKLPGADGLLLLGEDDLLVIQNLEGNRAVLLHTDDEWKTAKVVKTEDLPKDFPTTAVLGPNKRPYVMISKLNKLFGGKDVTDKEFVMHPVFESVQKAKK